MRRGKFCIDLITFLIGVQISLPFTKTMLHRFLIEGVNILRIYNIEKYILNG